MKLLITRGYLFLFGFVTLMSQCWAQENEFLHFGSGNIRIALPCSSHPTRSYYSRNNSYANGGQYYDYYGAGESGDLKDPYSDATYWENNFFSNPFLVTIPSGQIAGIYLRIIGGNEVPGETVTIWSVESSPDTVRNADLSNAVNAQAIFDDLGNGSTWGTFSPGLSPADFMVTVAAASPLGQYITQKLSAGQDFALGCVKTSAHANPVTSNNYFLVDLIVERSFGPTVTQVQTTTPVSPAHVTGTQATLSATITNDDAGDVVTWSISPNADGSTIVGSGSLGNRTATATFKKATTYTITCTATENGSSSSKDATVTVDQTLTSLELPKAFLVGFGGQVTVTADGKDQFTDPMTTAPTGVTYTVANTTWGTITPAGVFTAGSDTSSAQTILQVVNVTATKGALTASGVIKVMDAKSVHDAIGKDGTAQNADGGSSNSHAEGADPIVYSSGEIDLSAEDIASAGFTPWSVSRSYANTRDLGATALGPHWYLNQLPFVVDLQSSYLVQFSALGTHVFTHTGAIIAPLRYQVENLAAQNTDLVYTDGGGNRWIFNDFSNATASLRGKLRGYQDAAGNLTVIGYNANAQPVTATRSASDGGTGTISEQFQYGWRTDGLLSDVKRVVTRGGVAATVRRVVYDYYTGAAGDSGAAGELKSAVVQDGAGAALEADYYRYWKTGELYLDGTTAIPASAVGQLKYVLSPRAVARLRQNVGDPLTTAVPEATIAAYATKYFEYDSLGRVTKQALRGDGIDATGISTYAYALPRTVANDYNLWKFTTVETLPDGTTNTVYSNYAGATLAFATREAVAPNRTWIHAYRYDAQGREIWHATPAAVTGVTETADDLGLTGAVTANAPNVLDTTGLIETSAFAPTTDSGTGASIVLRTQRCIQQGETNTPELVHGYTYQLHQGN